MKIKPLWIANLSLLTFSVAVATGFWFVIGAGTDPEGGTGPFGFLLLPSLLCLAVAFLTQQIAIRGFKREEALLNAGARDGDAA